MDKQLSPFWMSLLAREIERTNDNPHLTFETIVTRVLRRVSESFHLPWVPYLGIVSPSSLFDGFQSAPGFAQNMESTLQKYHFGRATLHGMHIGSRQCDGYQGDDPKKYVELFRYGAENIRGKHVRAVRLLYRYEVVNNPQECRSFLESIFDGTCTNTEYKDMYVDYVLGQLADMAEWRQQTKRSNPLKKTPMMPRNWPQRIETAFVAT
ncbi:uncharacterized protein TNCV_4686781 [Trichonephila clavipes]|nr:uncharacterized protein TNCV_4686781 [Trichonephila clavipes]